MSRFWLLVPVMLAFGSHAGVAAQPSWCTIDDPARLRNPATANAPCPTPADPQTLPDRLALPLPCFGYLLLSKVVVSATTVLDDQKVHLGSPPPDAGDPVLPGLIEGPQVAILAGGFNHGEGPRNPKQAVEFTRLNGRSYYIAAYPLTDLQARRIRLVGETNADPTPAACKAATDALAEVPRGDVRAMSGLSWFEANDLVRRYQNWLLARDRAAIAARGTPALPWEQGSPSYLRLPTEAEWEFAARGGAAEQEDQARAFYKVVDAANGPARMPDFDEIALPRDAGDDRRPPRLGQKLPNRLGLYDLLGTVEQMTLEPFRLTRPDELHGQAGGYVLKGGDYLTREKFVRVGHRRELPYYDFDGETRGANVGIRLALSVPVFVGGRSPNPGESYAAGRPNQKYLDALAAARQRLVADTSTDRGRADAGLDTLREQADTVDREELRKQLDAIKTDLDRSNARLAAADTIARREALQEAVLLAANFRAMRHSNETNTVLIKVLSDLTRSCLRAADQRNLLSSLDGASQRTASLGQAVQPTLDLYMSRLQDLARLPQDQREIASAAVARNFRGRGLTQYETFQNVVVRQVDMLAAANNALSDRLRRAWADELYNAFANHSTSETPSMRTPLASGWTARGRAGILVLALTPSLLQGCATGHQYDAYRDQSDQCYYARAPLIATGDNFEKTVLGATATGAAIGGLGGAALGAAIGGSWKAALIGAAAGALAGSLGGYLNAKHKQAQTQSALLASIDQDAQYDTVAVNGTTSAIRGLIACRNMQTARIEAAYGNKTMTRQQALDAYRDIQARSDQDDKLITTLLGAADERGAKYVSARADVLTLREPAQAASPATEQLATARQTAQVEEQNYKQFRDNMNQRVNELVKAIG